MPISIIPDRYQQLISAIDTKANTETRQRIHQWLKNIGICATTKKWPTPDLNNQQIDLLEKIILRDDHTTTKIELYFSAYLAYNKDVKVITVSPLYEEDLAKLQSFNLIQMQDEKITLNTTPRENTHIAKKPSNIHSQSTTEISHLLSSAATIATQSTTLHRAKSAPHLAKKRKKTASSIEAATLSSQLPPAEQNDKRAKISDYEPRIAKLEQDNAALQANYQTLQAKLDTLEAKLNNQNQSHSHVLTDSVNTSSPTSFLFPPLSPLRLSAVHLSTNVSLFSNEEDTLPPPTSGM